MKTIAISDLSFYEEARRSSRAISGGTGDSRLISIALGQDSSTLLKILVSVTRYGGTAAAAVASTVVGGAAGSVKDYANVSVGASAGVNVS